MALGLIAGALAAGAGSYAYAALTGTNPSYTACLAKGVLSNVAIGTAPSVACGKNQTQISWNQIGPQGSPGVQGVKGDTGDKGDRGDPGPKGDAGTSFANTPCATEAGIAPNGALSMSVDYATGAATFKCTTPNPSLSLTARDIVGSLVCIPFSGCVAYFTGNPVVEVDATGAAVDNGFGCTSGSNDEVTTRRSTTCQTKRYPAGTTARFATLTTSGTVYTQVDWIGCDAASGGICTVTMNGDRSITSTGTASS